MPPVWTTLLSRSLCVSFAHLAGLCVVGKRETSALAPKLSAELPSCRAAELILAHECACQAFYLEQVAELYLSCLSLVPAAFAGLFRRVAGFFALSLNRPA